MRLASYGLPQAALLVLLGVGQQAAAAVIDFDNAVCEEPPQACGNGLRIHQSVGDIPGQLDVTYTNRSGPGNSDPLTVPLSGIRWFDTGYGDLNGVLWGRGDNGVAEIALIPAAGYQVTLLGFQLGSFYPDIDTQFTIYDGEYSPLLSSGPLTLDDFGPGGRIHYTYNFSLTSASGIILQWGPDSYYVGLDNLRFEVTPVPGPASVFLLGTGLAGLLGWRRVTRTA